MSYQGKWDAYRDLNERGRYEACVREQGYIFSADGRPDIAALGMGVVAGSVQDIDAVIAAICTGESWDALGDDEALVGAVQNRWPTVAAARYPQDAA